VRDQVSHPYKTTGKIILLENLIFPKLIEIWHGHNLRLIVNTFIHYIWPVFNSM
jgi:hypothetical protein